MSGVVASAVLCRRALREIPRVPGRIAFPMLIPIMQMILFAAVFQNFGQYRTGGAGIELLAHVLQCLIGDGALVQPFQRVGSVTISRMVLDQFADHGLDYAYAVVGTCAGFIARLPISLLARCAAGRARRKSDFYPAKNFHCRETVA